jgi:hypothetical protein
MKATPLSPTRTIAAIFACCVTVTSLVGAVEVKVGVFDVDASPPVGSPLAYDPTEEVEIPLSCRGIVLLSNDNPIVLCAVDWIGIANDGHKIFRSELARAAETTPDRVALHTLHQHDAPVCDFSTDQLLAQYGINHHFFDSVFARHVMEAACAAVATAKKEARPVTHVGLGSAMVEKVASNRRILGPDGKVQFVRWTATADALIREQPVGTIDPWLKSISFWQGDNPIAVLTYYATHPQSYYRTKKANPDFPGIARNNRQAATGVPHIHFNGAGGNIGAGKWNDGSPANRMILAQRVATGMSEAWDATEKSVINAEDVGWKSLAVSLPAAEHLNEQKLMAVIADEKADVRTRGEAAHDLVWLRRCQSGDTVPVSCLRLGNLRVLHMPGELFVEYQLIAKQLRSDVSVAMAAYGDYGPGYIGTEIAYAEGGYETSPRASRVAPNVETIILTAMRELLNESDTVRAARPSGALQSAAD